MATKKTTSKVTKEKKVKAVKPTAELSTAVYNQKGKEVETIALPETVFGLGWNADLVHQVVTALQSNARAGTADARDRSRVAGGGRKPWKQKGTGRARHGSIRSPIWKGGGVTHGPKAEKVYLKKVNKKMRTKALFTALSKKFADGQVLFIDTMSFPEIKTKNAASLLGALSNVRGFDRLGGSRKVVAHITAFGAETNAKKSFANIPYVVFDDVQNINVLDVLMHKYLVISNPAETLQFFTKKLDAKRD